MYKRQTIGDAKIIDTSKMNADTVQILTKVELKNGLSLYSSNLPFSLGPFWRQTLSVIFIVFSITLSCYTCLLYTSIESGKFIVRTDEFYQLRIMGDIEGCKTGVGTLKFFQIG